MSSELHPESAEPLYQQLVHKIRDEIDSGVYSVGQRLPSEEEMCPLYGVSRITVRKALEKLSEAGVLERRQGKGTFVSVLEAHKDLRRIASFHTVCESIGKKPSTKLIRAKDVPSDERDRKDLKLPENSRVIEIIRTRLADDVPVILEVNRFSMAYSYLVDCNLNDSLYNLLGGFGVVPQQAKHDISLCKATEKQAELLGIEPESPLLYLYEVIYDQKGRPLHTSRQYIRGDKYTLKL